MVVGSARPEEMRRCGFRVAPTPEEAIEALRRDQGEEARVLVIPRALAVIPVAEDP
jgi:hypothetical protein